MRKKEVLCGVVAALWALLLLCGCGRLIEGSYTVITDHTEAAVDPEAGDQTIEVRTYSGMKNAVQSLVNANSEFGLIRAVEYSGSVSEDISKACLDVTRDSALGAYAVEYMTHTVNRILSYYEIEVHVSYKLSFDELAQLKSVSTLADMYRLVDEALAAGTESLAVQVATLAITERTLITYVENFYRTHPSLLAMQPSVSVVFYPSEDYVQKIITFKFDFHKQPEACQAILLAVNDVAEDLTRELRGLKKEEAAMLCCEAIRTGLSKQSRGRTAYNALIERQANSEGCAMAYQLLCDLCGVDCQVVTGRLNSETHYWNIIKLDRLYYHVDVSATVGGLLSDGFLKQDNDLWGSYWWDVDKYPVCQGILSAEQVLNQYILRQQAAERGERLGAERVE